MSFKPAIRQFYSQFTIASAGLLENVVDSSCAPFFWFMLIFSSLSLLVSSHNLNNFCQLGNPWEIIRNDISYPVKFYGEVITRPDGSKEWIGGEDINVVAYDVSIPGHKTKIAINLRLLSTKVPCEGFNLKAFNASEHAKASKSLKNAEKV